MPDIDGLKAALADRYSIGRELGAGGMATVYLAEDLKHHRKVAIKVLRPDLASVIGPERFLREIQIAANLTHPHILPLHDSGEAGGFLYYVMPYLEGETLRQRLDRETHLSLEDALRITREIADALGAAHRQGVVHRDIKPENILFTEGHAVIADFGIAWAVTEAGGEQLTETGLSVGTPAYMSPEQAGGEHEIDGRSDIYSLGCVAFEMLVGEPPFTGPTPVAVTARKLTEPVPRIGVVRDVPGAVEDAIQKSLARVPADRFAAPEQFSAALTSAFTGGQVHDSRERPAPRRTGPLMGLAALIVVVTGALGVWWATSSEVEAPAVAPGLAVLPFDNLGSPDEDYFAAGMTEEITSRLAEISGLRVISRQSAMQYQDSEKSLGQIGEELGVDFVLEGTIRTDRTQDGVGQMRVTPQLINVTDDAHLWTDRYTITLVPGEIFAVQERLAEEVARALDVTLLEPERRRLASRPTDNLEAYDFFLRGNEYANGDREDSEIALAMYEQAVALDSTFAEAYAHLSRTHSWFWWLFWDRTEERLALAKAAVDRALMLDPDLPEAHAAMGYYHYWGFLDYDNALREFAIAQAAQPNNSDVALGIAFVRRRQGRIRESLASFHRALELEPRSDRVAGHLGYTYSLARNRDEAARYVDRAVALSPDEPGPYIQKAWVIHLRHDGDTQKARSVLEEAGDVVADHEVVDRLWVLLDVVDRDFERARERLALMPPVALSDQYRFLLTAQLRAEVELWSGNAVAARAYYDSTRMALEPLVRDQPDDARYHSSLGIAYAGLGRTEDAVREGELGVELLPVSREAWRGAYRVEDLARIYTMVGRPDDAIDQLEFLLSNPSDVTTTILALDPTWDPLRDRPRFQRLLE
jgi:serine/threonine-protein kinase